MWRKRIGVVLVVLGILAVAGSFVWRSVAVPALVKYPTDLDETPKYAGTVTIFLDPASNAPLASPIVAPLAVSRHVKADGAQSNDTRVIVDETIDLAATGQFSGTLKAVYAMDRRKAVNLTDPRTWAFTPANTVDRSGAYRLQFPFDLDAKPVKIYKNEIAATYTATPVGEGKVEGLDVINFSAVQTPVPVSPYYLTELDKLTKLPRELSLDQLKPILKANGVDVDVLLPALLPKLSKEDTAALLTLAGQPIKLSYLFGFQGKSSVEKNTGSVVDVQDVETLYVTPDAAALPPLVNVLAKYPDVPEAVTALTNLEKLAKNPVKVFTNDFAQTAASKKDIASSVRDKADQKKLAESTLPMVLLVGGIVLVLVGIVLYGFGRRATKAPAAPTS